jgi:predicted transcriptional regulator
MKTARQELIELLERLPDDAPMDSLLAQMHFKASILRGLDEAHRGEGISHEELKDRLIRWRESSGRQKPSEA